MQKDKTLTTKKTNMWRYDWFPIFLAIICIGLLVASYWSGHHG